MSSKIKVDTIENVAGSGNVSLGSGHNLVVPGNITGQGTTTLTGNLTVDTNTLFVDTSNNRVGIGTASPADQLELLAGSERLMIGANSPSTFSRVAARNTGDSGYRGLKIDGSDLLLNTESGTGNIIMSTGSDKVRRTR